MAEVWPFRKPIPSPTQPMPRALLCNLGLHSAAGSAYRKEAIGRRGTLPRVRIEWVPVQMYGLGHLGFDHLQLVFEPGESGRSAQDDWFVGCKGLFEFPARVAKVGPRQIDKPGEPVGSPT